MQRGSTPKRARTSADPVGSPTGVIDCARKLGAELKLRDPKPVTIRNFVAALKGSTGQHLPQHARDAPYSLMLHLARGKEDLALKTLSEMCQLAQEEALLAQIDALMQKNEDLTSNFSRLHRVVSESVVPLQRCNTHAAVVTHFCFNT